MARAGSAAASQALDPVRRAVSFIGTLLVLASLAGLAGIGALAFGVFAEPVQEAPPIQATYVGERAVVEVAPVIASGSAESHAPVAAQVAAPVADPAPLRTSGPITRIAISSIDLDSDVVPATVVDREGGLTWDVPAFRVGHAQGTAAAGDIGNAVLFGHVTSIRSGDVFKDLARVRAGDAIEIFSGERMLTYQVLEVASVSRADVSVIAPTQTASLTLITCAGVWLPTIWDYTERLVVRAELAGY